MEATPVRRATGVTVRERILTLLADFAPMPLTYDDLMEELGLTRKHAQQEIKELHKVGCVTRTGTLGPGAITYIRLAGDAT